MTWSMIGGTLVLIKNTTIQSLQHMASNHTQCIGMESKVKKNELRIMDALQFISRRSMSVL
jgi:hypothetical protein